MDFIAARNFNRVGRDHVRLVVIHDMESSEKPGTARAVARWFAGMQAPRASAHLCVDCTEVVECVKPQDVAWAAPGANRDGYHVEMAGAAKQSLTEWQDTASRATMRLAARAVAPVCRSYDIPVVKLSPEEVADGKRGFCGHVDVTRAYHKSDHTDPGPNFPWDTFLGMVEEELGALNHQEANRG